MNGKKGLSVHKPIRNWILYGIPVAFILGTVLHFVYDWTDKSALAGIFSPVNESVWEHLKLPFWPLLIWWVVGFFLFRKKGGASPARWFCCCAVSLWVSILFIIVVHYSYTGIFGGESMLVDILIMLAGIALAQALALRTFKRSNIREGSLVLALIAVILPAAAFIVFTFVPPKIPLFMDTQSNTYGIYSIKK